jgi:hypothetical protein
MYPYIHAMDVAEFEYVKLLSKDRGQSEVESYTFQRSQTAFHIFYQYFL